MGARSNGDMESRTLLAGGRRWIGDVGGAIIALVVVVLSDGDDLRHAPRCCKESQNAEHDKTRWVSENENNSDDKGVKSPRSASGIGT